MNKALDSHNRKLIDSKGYQSSLNICPVDLDVTPKADYRWDVNPVLCVAKPPPKPLLVYDGDCGFCVRRAKRWRQVTAEAVDYVALQAAQVAEKFPELPRARLVQSVHLIEPDGSVYQGAEAVLRLFAFKNRFPLRLYRTVPGFAPCAELFYRLVARHRPASCKPR